MLNNRLQHSIDNLKAIKNTIKAIIIKSIIEYKIATFRCDEEVIVWPR